MKIIFKSDKVTKKQQKEIKTLISEKMKELSDLELSTLETIIITEDFAEDVKNTQKKYQMREFGYTNRKDGVAVAKVIHTKLNEELKQTIIINDYLIQGLFNPKLAQSSFHLLHHELCHVHENYYQHIIFTPEGSDGENTNQLEHILLYNAQPVWSEYFAVRKSSGSISLELLEDLYFNYLGELIVSCRNRIKNEINKYRIHADTRRLFSFLQEETTILFKIAATSQGYLDGLDISDEHRISIMIDEHISETYFYNSWLEQWKSLNNLYNLFPNWNDVYQLHDLGQSILECWSDLGITPSIKEDNNLYIDVPF
jgi:hypothetical protein